LTQVGEMLEKMAAEYSETEGYFVGGKLTWVDVYGFHMFTRCARRLPRVRADRHDATGARRQAAQSLQAMRPTHLRWCW
jgi:glutathione S-transferase